MLRNKCFVSSPFSLLIEDNVSSPPRHPLRLPLLRGRPVQPRPDGGGRGRGQESAEYGADAEEEVLPPRRERRVAPLWVLDGIDKKDEKIRSNILHVFHVMRWVSLSSASKLRNKIERKSQFATCWVFSFHALSTWYLYNPNKSCGYFLIGFKTDHYLLATWNHQVTKLMLQCQKWRTECVWLEW